MTKDEYAFTWDLETFFKGGSDSKEFQVHLTQVATLINQFEQHVTTWEQPSSNENNEAFLTALDYLQKSSQMLHEASAFVSCLQAQDTSDMKAKELRGQVTQLSAKLQTVLTVFDEKLVHIPDQIWKSLIQVTELIDIQYILTERRQRAAEKLSREQESLIHALSVDGYRGWEEMYNTLVSHVHIPFEENGVIKELSVGQAANQFSHPDREVRKKVFKNWQTAWEKEADTFATTLNHLAGFRLAVYDQRGWDDILKEPLNYNRMKKQTLHVMWDVIADNKDIFVQFLSRKAKLLGVEKLSWYDVDAPIGKTNKKYSYQEGANFIIEHFNKFGTKLTSMTKRAFAERWIEAEDRPGKKPGGFCTTFPISEQSRIFMTYSGTASNIATLAHELGHAFHSFVLKNVHPLNKGYAMNVAETASTFAEMIVADAAVKSTTDREEKLTLLEDKIQRSVVFFMNIHARFLFETRFYEERKKGIISKARLNELMVDAQKEAFNDSLAEYDPTFWASKLHFFITNVPFYNFPYTFGYLFSLGIYAKALAEGKGYEEKYIALLQDTGAMTVEDLAKKHLDVDLTERAFWEEAIKLCVHDVERFLQMTN